MENVSAMQAGPVDDATVQLMFQNVDRKLGYVSLAINCRK